MLLPLKLQSFLEECKTDITAIGWVRALTDESEFSSSVRDIVTEDTNISLIGVLPNVRLKGDLDNITFSNTHLFYCVKKTDSKAGDENYLQIFEDCANAVLELLAKFKKDQAEGDGLCKIGEFIFNSASIEPVRGYLGTNGYVLNIDLITV